MTTIPERGRFAFRKLAVAAAFWCAVFRCRREKARGPERGPGSEISVKTTIKPQGVTMLNKMKLLKLSACSTSLLLAGAMAAQAQQGTGPETVVVTGSRII